MRYTILFTIVVSIVFFLSQCGQKEDPNKLYTTADSLVNLALDLQSRIGSPDIQRLHDFEEEITLDLEMLTQLPEKDTSILKYLTLQNGLGQCMHACNQYHEEAFLLESSLREIMEQVESKEANLKDLEKMLDFEIENYIDLSKRIDSSLDLAIHQAETFYSLKPEIDKIKQGLDSLADPIP
ncbi:hypothetical protein ACFLTA_02250 [Bacteroidota bacterium]